MSLVQARAILHQAIEEAKAALAAHDGAVLAAKAAWERNQTVASKATLVARSIGQVSGAGLNTREIGSAVLLAAEVTRKAGEIMNQIVTAKQALEENRARLLSLMQGIERIRG